MLCLPWPAFSPPSRRGVRHALRRNDPVRYPRRRSGAPPAHRPTHFPHISACATLPEILNAASWALPRRLLYDMSALEHAAYGCSGPFRGRATCLPFGRENIERRTTPHGLAPMRRYHTMARQQAAQRPSGVGRNGRRASTPLLFEPELAVRAIVFHILDEGIAAQVSDDSIRASVVRLRRTSVRPTVEQSVWSEMTNPQRLEWLMEKTQTASRLIDDEVSILEAATDK